MRRAFNYALAWVTAMMVIAPSVATAAFTSIGPSSIATEHNHQQILSTIYGGSFVASGLNFSNGTITATRIEDTSSVGTLTAVTTLVSTQTDAGPLGGDDQLWSGAYTSFTAKAIFAWFDEEFGYYDGATGGTYHKLVDPNGSGYALTSAINTTTVDQPILRWARAGESRIVTSQISDHPDNKDHMLTYKITGLNNGRSTWLLLFEDKFVGEKVDFDYNDLVVQIEAFKTAQVPEPILLAPASMAVSFALAGRRRSFR